jgi:hypothetical protein
MDLEVRVAQEVLALAWDHVVGTTTKTMDRSSAEDSRRNKFEMIGAVRNTRSK